MKRSALLAGLMVLAAASNAAAQGRSVIGNLARQAELGRGAAGSQPAVQNACPAGAYSVVQSPDGASVSILFHQFAVETDGALATTHRTTCRIEVPLAVPTGFSAALTSVDYRGFALLGQRQSAEISVDYEVGRGNRAPRFQRRLQGVLEGDFAFTDRLPPGRLRQAGCGARGTAPSVLAIDAALTLNGAASGDQAMISLDSADQTATGALRYRFDVQPCDRRIRQPHAY